MRIHTLTIGTGLALLLSLPLSAQIPRNKDTQVTPGQVMVPAPEDQFDPEADRVDVDVNAEAEADLNADVNDVNADASAEGALEQDAVDQGVVADQDYAADQGYVADQDADQDVVADQSLDDNYDEDVLPRTASPLALLALLGLGGAGTALGLRRVRK